MKVHDIVFMCTIIIINIAATYAAYVAAPPEATMGDTYRVFYVHTPAAWICYLALGISLVASIVFLIKRNFRYDRIAEISAILGLIYGAIAIIGGSLWANAIWGVYWNWDPRETTTLILWIAYLGYVSLRLSIDNLEKKAKVGAVYNILAFVTVPLSYLSVKLWQTLHPQIITPSGLQITRPMIETLLLNLVASSLIFVYLLKVLYDFKILKERVEALESRKGG